MLWKIMNIYYNHISEFYVHTKIIIQHKAYFEFLLEYIYFNLTTW